MSIYCLAPIIVKHNCSACRRAEGKVFVPAMWGSKICKYSTTGHLNNNRSCYRFTYGDPSAYATMYLMASVSMRPHKWWGSSPRRLAHPMTAPVLDQLKEICEPLPNNVSFSLTIRQFGSSPYRSMTSDALSSSLQRVCPALARFNVRFEGALLAISFGGHWSHGRN